MLRRGILIAFLVFSQFIFTTPKVYIEVYVPRVVDGDTFVIRYGSRTDKVRIIGIDAPESVHPRKPIEYYGPEASQYLKGLLKDRWVILTFDASLRDRYRRLLATARIGDKSVAADLVTNGYARAYRPYPFKEYLEIVGLDRYSRVMGLGLWSRGPPKAKGYAQMLGDGQ